MVWTQESQSFVWFDRPGESSPEDYCRRDSLTLRQLERKSSSESSKLCMVNFWCVTEEHTWQKQVHHYPFPLPNCLQQCGYILVAHNFSSLYQETVDDHTVYAVSKQLLNVSRRAKEFGDSTDVMFAADVVSKLVQAIGSDEEVRNRIVELASLVNLKIKSVAVSVFNRWSVNGAASNDRVTPPSLLASSPRITRLPRA